MNSPYQQFGPNALAQPPRGPLAKLLAFVLSAAFLILAFMFSLVALVIVAVAGLILGGWLWWRTRQLRREINRSWSSQHPTDAGTSANGPAYEPPSSPRRSATIIEGEAVRMTDEPAAAPLHRVE
ncbi:hypothetical protein LZ012_18080 [Dechloromonas sp. XY25]|uniref:Uncharacterized protein n=1 Tax=Dechloromonas hankyongensis TaxID=2908002 RepID=A0ABS9K6Y3_9RHOO|nr:hypothetical protein [Dechloromonas hankyongensis]MCG2578906.1 hypothetical protein [Dechloromonas hankyongensis]